ncbi:hypothetical protein [Alloprevotella tannerae]
MLTKIFLATTTFFLPNKALCHTPFRIYVSFAAGKPSFAHTKPLFAATKSSFAGSKRKNNQATSLASTPSNRAMQAVFHRFQPQPITHLSRWRPQASTRLIKKEEKPLQQRTRATRAYMGEYASLFAMRE